jgi:uncharacterized lipoprotein YajG
MKRLTLVASVFILAACTAKDTATTDSTGAAMAPAPAPAPMTMDSAAMRDSLMRDSIFNANRREDWWLDK